MHLAVVVVSWVLEGSKVHGFGEGVLTIGVGA